MTLKEFQEEFASFGEIPANITENSIICINTNDGIKDIKGIHFVSEGSMAPKIYIDTK